MTPLQRSIAKVRRRVATARALHVLGWGVMIGLCVATLVLIADRRLLLGIPDWSYGLLGVSAVVIALLMAFRDLPNEADAAVLLDDKLGLKDKLGTSMYTAGLAEQNELTAQVAREADEAARQAASMVKKAAPITVNPVWNLTPIAMIVLAGVWFFVPQAPAQTPEEIAQAQEEERERAVAEEASEVIINTIDPHAEVEEDKYEGVEMSADTEDRLVSISNEIRNDPASAERRIAEAESLISDAESRIGEQREIIEAAYDPLRNDSSALDPGQQGPADNFAQAMNRGDFESAAEALADLQEKINDEEAFSEDERQALQDQLNNLSDQLERQAQEAEERQQQAREEARRNLEDRLQREGMSPEQARDMAEQLTSEDKPGESGDNGEQQQGESGEQQANGEQQQEDNGEQQANGEQRQGESGEQQRNGEGQQQSRQERIQQALQQQGMSEQEAREQAARINEELERQDRQASGQQQSGQMQQQLSEGLEQMASQCEKPGKPGEEGQQGSAAQQAMNQMADMQRQLNGLQQDQERMQDAMDQLGQMRDRGFDAVPGVGEGGGRRSPYEGQQGPRVQGPIESYESREDVTDREGRVIASWAENGEGQGGEATVSFNESRTQAQLDAERAVTEEYVPRTHHRAITEYFDRLPEDPNAGRAPAAPR